MLRKILKYALRALIVLLLLPFLVGGLLYIPGIQNALRRQAEVLVARHLGMELSIGRIRLTFPLRLVVAQTLLVDRGDTLLGCERLAVDVAPLGLLRGQADVRRFEISGAMGHYRDTLSGMEARAEIGALILRTNRIDLRNEKIGIRSVELAQSDIDLRLGTPAAAPKEADTTASPAAWEIGLGELAITNTAVRVCMDPGPSEIDVHLAEASVEGCRVDMRRQEIAVGAVFLGQNTYVYRTTDGKEQAEATKAVGTEESAEAVEAAESAGSAELAESVGAAESAGSSAGASARASARESGSVGSAESSAGASARASAGESGSVGSAESSAGASARASAGAAESSAPWDIRIGRIELAENRIEYIAGGGKAGGTSAAARGMSAAARGGTSAAAGRVSAAVGGGKSTAGGVSAAVGGGFDPADIRLSELDLVVDSLRSHGAGLSLKIAHMQFVEQCGFVLKDLSGGFALEADTLLLAGLRIATPQSELQADLHASARALELDPAAPLTFDLSARISLQEAGLFVPGLGDSPLRGLRAQVGLQLSGVLGDIDPIRLELSSPGLLAFVADGSAKNLPDMRRAEADIRFDGKLREAGFLLKMLPDTALRRRVALPRLIGLQGGVRLREGVYALRTAAEVGQGRLSAEGVLDPATRVYRAELRCDSFPLGEFLPHDSLGTVVFHAEARGRGFDPLDARTRLQVEAEMPTLEFRGRDFGGIGLQASLERGRLEGQLTDSDEALLLELALDGALSPERQQFGVKGRVRRFDLAALGVAADSISGSFALDAAACIAAPDSLAARVAFDDIVLAGSEEESPIRPTGAVFSTARSGVRAELYSGDFRMRFESPTPLDSLTAALARSIDTLRQQIGPRGIDMERLQPLLPAFRLQASAGEENIVNNFLRTKQVAFEHLEIDGGNGPRQPFAFGMRVDGLSAAGVAIDTLGFGIRQQGAALGASLRVADRPDGKDSLARTALDLRAAGAGAEVMIRRDAPGEVPVRFGLGAAWNDREVTLRVLPDLGTWQVNPGNYITYAFSRDLRADLELTRGAQRFALHTVTLPELPGAVRLDIAGLDIGRTLGMLPAAPPVGGVLATELTAGMSPDSLNLRAQLTLDSLSYDGQRFGDVLLRADYARGHGHKGGVHFALDGAEMLAVEGVYTPGAAEPLDVEGAIRAFPLQRVNVFLPEELLRLAGSLNGEVRVGGSLDRPRFDGGIRFAQTEVRVPMIGTAFRLAEDSIRIAGTRIAFDDFAILPPNNNPLMISGAVDLSKPALPTADLRLRARNFQFLDVARRERTAVYGTGYLNLDASARGPLDEMVVRGNVALLRGTQINYVMQEMPSEIEQQSQDVVSFVSFAEEDAAEPAAPAADLRIGGLDLLMNVDISDDVQMGVDLSTDGSNRIDLRGGGSLSYAMNPLGDIAFSGKYTLSGGTVRYNPPVISQKVFAIRPGSYVEWTGEIADPSFDITAVETVRASVSADDNQSRPVNFEISVNIRNSLNNLDVSFGLAAPDDLSMQNQLQSLTPQQRAMQAMNLLIYNTYTGPGTTAKVNTENPLNAFVQKELNQWAQNSLKGVDLSFGIDSYDQTDPNGARTDYSYRLSKKFFGDRVQIVIGGKFSTGADPSENLKENMIDDISLEYLLTKRGNMLLRVFRHTGYESILEGEITETGVGFIIRKKMARPGDLFRSQRRQDKKTKNNDPETH